MQKGVATNPSDASGRPADEETEERIDRMHVVGVCPARRRHSWGPPLLGGEGRRAGLRQARARELGNDGICVNCVMPGLIQTDINAVYVSESVKSAWPSTKNGKLHFSRHEMRGVAGYRVSRNDEGR